MDILTELSIRSEGWAKAAHDEIVKLRELNGTLYTALAKCRDSLGGRWDDTPLAVEAIGDPKAVPDRVKEAVQTLQTAIVEAQARENKLRTALQYYTDPSQWKEHISFDMNPLDRVVTLYPEKIVAEHALDTPQDDSALKEIIKAERLKCADEVEEWVYGKDAAEELRRSTQ